jgi:hypothetical protein
MISEWLEDGHTVTLSRWATRWIPCLILAGLGYAFSRPDETLDEFQAGAFIWWLIIVSFAYYAGGAFRDNWMSKYSSFRQQ